MPGFIIQKMQEDKLPASRVIKIFDRKMITQISDDYGVPSSFFAS